MDELLQEVNTIREQFEAGTITMNQRDVQLLDIRDNRAQSYKDGDKDKFVSLIRACNMALNPH